MFRNGHQELLFPICRSIRRLVDEGKPAVVSTAELFETKMKVLENVTGPRVTLPETNIAPQNGWLEDEFPFGMAYFQGQTVSFREGTTKTGHFKVVKQSPKLGRYNLSFQIVIDI